jgi:hypothetical protein
MQLPLRPGRAEEAAQVPTTEHRSPVRQHDAGSALKRCAEGSEPVAAVASGT